MHSAAKNLNKIVKNDLNAVDFFRAKLQFESTPHALKDGMEKGAVHLIDLRDPQSFALEHIPGAVNIPLAELSKNFSTLPKNKTLVVYCWNITCAMSTKGALQLAEKGFQVQELFGGLAEYKAKFPVEKSA